MDEAAPARRGDRPRAAVDVPVINEKYFGEETRKYSPLIEFAGFIKKIIPYIIDIKINKYVMFNKNFLIVKIENK